MASTVTLTPIPSTTPVIDKLLTTPETASMLGIKPSTLVEYRKRSSGPAYVRINSHVVRYKLSDVLSYIASQESVA